MKILIWFACIFVTSLIQVLFGFKLGAIPAIMFFGATFYIAKNFSTRYDNRKNKATEEYFDTGKGLAKGFIWYGSSILYVLLGTIFYSSYPESFNIIAQLIIAIICIGVALIGVLLVDKFVNFSPTVDSKVDEIKTENNNMILYCRKCGTKLDDNNKLCSKCGTKIKEEV